jgi:AraC-like DNA-binding protein
MMGRPKAPFDVDWARRLYIDEKRSIESIALEAGVGRTTVRERFSEAGIDMGRNGKPSGGRRPFPIDPEWLRRAYCEEMRTLHSIAEEVGCEYPTVRARLRSMGVPIRSKPGRETSQATLTMTREYVLQQLAQGETPLSIAQKLGCSRGTVKNRFREYGLSMRVRPAGPRATEPEPKSRPPWHEALRAELEEFKRVRALVWARVGYVSQAAPWHKDGEEDEFVPPALLGPRKGRRRYRVNRSNDEGLSWRQEQGRESSRFVPRKR